MNCQKVRTKPVTKVTSVNTQMAMFMVFLAPHLSARNPAKNWAMQYPKKKIDPSHPISTAFKPRSF